MDEDGGAQTKEGSCTMEGPSEGFTRRIFGVQLEKLVLLRTGLGCKSRVGEIAERRGRLRDEFFSDLGWAVDREEERSRTREEKRRGQKMDFFTK